LYQANFPNLTQGQKQQRATQSQPTVSTTPASPTIDNSSNHSRTSAASTGTTFTRDDAQSLFTMMSTSFVSDMTSRHEEMMNTMIKNDEKYKEAQLANEAKYQAAQLPNDAKHKEAQAAQLKSDERFERLMQKLTTKIMEDAPRTRRQK
jgi:hypothetical protein